MSSANDRIIQELKLKQELKKTFGQLKQQRKTRKRGRRGKIEVYCELEPDEVEEIAQRVRHEESARAQKQLADISREFLKMKKVYRWQMTKVSNLSDNGVIHACHCYVEENRLNDEWKEFRKNRETYY